MANEIVTYPYEFEDENGKWRQLSKYSKVLIEPSESYVAKQKELEELRPKVEPPVPISKRVSTLEEQRIQAVDTAIELYEANLALQEVNAMQDDAIIELYELIGG